MEQLRVWAKGLKRELTALGFAIGDHRMPWYARLLAVLVVAYALSPVDLIPDFIPVLGYLDDLILLPLGIALVLRLTPREVMMEARQRAEGLGKPHKTNRWAAAVIILLWVGTALWLLWTLLKGA